MQAGSKRSLLMSMFTRLKPNSYQSYLTM